MNGFYIIFFINKNDEKEIIYAHRSEEYPNIGNIVYLLKNLEALEVNVNEVFMDIITEKVFLSL